MDNFLQYEYSTQYSSTSTGNLITVLSTRTVELYSITKWILERESVTKRVRERE